MNNVILKPNPNPTAITETSIHINAANVMVTMKVLYQKYQRTCPKSQMFNVQLKNNDLVIIKYYYGLQLK